MIGRLKGSVADILADHIVVDVHGVGYIVYCHQKLLSSLVIGEEAVLFIEHVVKEYEHKFFGFTDLKEKELFAIIKSVQGIAGKNAMSILGTLSYEEMLYSVKTGNYAIFTKVPGVGDKLAARIVSELNRNKDWKNFAVSLANDALDSQHGSEKRTISGTKSRTVWHDETMKKSSKVLSILVNLGFPKIKAEQVIDSVIALPENSSADLEQIVRLCLAQFNQH